LITTIALTALATLVVTVLAGFILDFARNSRSKLTYSVKDAVFIELESGKKIGAYVVSLRNTSKRVIKDIECHMAAPPAKLRNGGVEMPQGMQYSIAEPDRNLVLTVPYLNRNDVLTVTAIAEVEYSAPWKLSVAIRSPHELKTVETERDDRPRGFNRGFNVAAVIATVATSAAGGVLQIFMTNNTSQDVLTFAAATSNLPHLAELYATGPESIHYYNQADLICGLAASTSDRSEVDKYRRFLSLALQLASGMQHSSRGNLYYCRGKLDLQMGDNANAIQDFKQAIEYSASTVKTKSAVEPIVRDFLAANGLSL
jgi:hypothetical protein